MSEPVLLSDLQLAIMRVVWERGEATVSEVHGVLHDERGLATTTVATLLTRLEKRGVLGHRRDGRQFVYQALVSEDAVRRSMVAELADRVFEGNVTELVSHLLDETDLSERDLERVKQLLEAKSRERKGE